MQARRIVVKQNGFSEGKVVDGIYAVDSAGFGSMKLSAPSSPDEDGNTVMQTTPYLFVVTDKQEIIALRTDNSLLGPARVDPAQ